MVLHGQGQGLSEAVRWRLFLLAEEGFPGSTITRILDSEFGPASPSKPVIYAAIHRARAEHQTAEERERHAQEIRALCGDDAIQE